MANYRPIALLPSSS
ncbi:hypothetical protein LSH36_342g01026 [Paralvinella palmiformis]|uniref:Uncharacterized protein n=1 Tax=Paralvinella palmiformis TaxID=53620 RepID=A0AAD9N098_9ANNE|nr:hypothetical protein LSH36_342g01026 [Paralvinella palmiformis]